MKYRLSIIIAVAAGAFILYMIASTTMKKNDGASGDSDGLSTASADVAEGNPAPDFSLPGSDGTSLRLSDLKGKLVLLKFWATWCPPCRKEIPDFIDYQNRYRARGLEIVGIALDTPEAVRPFLRQSGVNYTILFGNDAVSSLYGGIQSIPTTFVIDREGTIRASYVGWQPPEIWEKVISRFL